MTNIYDIISTIKNFLEGLPRINKVTFWDLMEVALDKTSMYPLTHFAISQSTITSNTINVTVDLLFMDIVDYTKDINTDDKGDRQDATNLVDVYNTQLQMANALISELRRGDLYRDKFQLVGDPVCTPFKDKYENELAGWSVTLSINMPNNISIC